MDLGRSNRILAGVLGILVVVQVSGASTTPGTQEWSCTFEDLAKCKFLHYDPWSWTVVSASNQSIPLAPKRDHTFPKNASGHYLSYTNNTHIPKTSIQFSSTPMDGNYCLDFWYVLEGNKTNSLNVSLLAGYDPDKCIQEQWFNSKGETEQKWTKGHIQLPYGNYTIEIEAAIPNAKNASIVALDDIRVFKCRHVPPPPAEKWTCDFESDMCGFEKDQYAELDWSREKAGDASSKSVGRPRTDHTTGTENGYYVYLEAKNSSKARDQGRLVVPALHIPNDGAVYCGQFYFYSYNQSAEVVVYNVTNGNEENEINTVWTAKTDDYMMWNWVIAPLSPGTANLIFGMSVVKNMTSAGLALDDFKVIHCPLVAKVPKPSKSFMHEMDCSFETSGCGITDLHQSKYPWKRVRAGDISKPSKDVYGNTDGHFMYLDLTSNATTVQDIPVHIQSTMQTQPLLAFNDWCLDFYYYAYNPNSTQMPHITVSAKSESGRWLTVFQADGNIDTWRHARMNKLPSAQMSQIRFIGSVFNNTNSYLAVDQVVIGSCKNKIPDITTPSPTSTVTMVTVANATDLTTASAPTTSVTPGTIANASFITTQVTHGITSAPVVTTTAGTMTTESGVSSLETVNFYFLICLALRSILG